MSTVIARRIRATPIRLTSEAWEVICQLLAPDAQSSARAILRRADGVVGSAIASETPKIDAIVVRGSGPRIRIYCLYDDDAIAGEDASEGTLPEIPTTGDWRLSIPVPPEDYEWSVRAIKTCAPHITIRKAGEEVDESTEEKSAARATVRVNLKGFLKP